MQTALTKQIEVQLFTTPKGDKTCSKSTKESCVFLQGAKFGLAHACCLQPSGIYLMRYKEEGNEYLKPHEECVVWKDEE